MRLNRKCTTFWTPDTNNGKLDQISFSRNLWEHCPFPHQNASCGSHWNNVECRTSLDGLLTFSKDVQNAPSSYSTETGHIQKCTDCFQCITQVITSRALKITNCSKSVQRSKTSFGEETDLLQQYSLLELYLMHQFRSYHSPRQLPHH